MILEGFKPYHPDAAELYRSRRWWLGMAMGDMFDKACDRYPGKVAVVGGGVRYTFAALQQHVDTRSSGLRNNPSKKEKVQ